MTEVGEGRRVADRRRGTIGVLRRGAAARAGLRGRSPRPPSDAVRARAGGRRARPSEDQERHARVREDGGARRLPLLRRRRGGGGREPRRPARPLPRRGLRGRHRVRQPARHPRRGPARAPTPRRASSPGTTATRTRATSEFDLSATRAVVVGNGNVAIDIARMLVLDPDELAPTDTADHALAALASAQVEEVILLGRRGPAQAAFTNPELRELGELSRAAPVVDPAELELDEHSRAWLEPRPTRPPSATTSCCARTASARSATRATASRCASCAPRSSCSARARTATVTGMRIVHNRIEPGRRRRAARGRDRPRGGHPLRARDPLDRLPRRPARRRPVRRAPRPDPQRRRPRVRRGRRAARGRVLRRLDQARPERRDRHEQEGRGRHGRARSSRTPRPAGCPSPPSRRRRRGDRRVAARQRPRRRRVGRLAGDRRARARPRRGRQGRPRVKLVSIDELVDASRGTPAAR